MNENYTERRCSVCNKISWDSDGGTYHYNESHVNQETGNKEQCDTHGAIYVNGVRQ